MEDEGEEARREKNRAAVRRSREKSRQQAMEVQSRIEQMTSENEQLERDAELLRKEVIVIRALYSAHLRSGHGLVLEDHELVSPLDATAAAALAQLNQSELPA